MREPGVAIGIVVLLGNTAPFAGYERGRDFTIRSGNGVLDARRHRQA